MTLNVGLFEYLYSTILPFIGQLFGLLSAIASYSFGVVITAFNLGADGGGALYYTNLFNGYRLTFTPPKLFSDTLYNQIVSLTNFRQWTQPFIITILELFLFGFLIVTVVKFIIQAIKSLT